jgi:hypothetical protein
MKIELVLLVVGVGLVFPPPRRPGSLYGRRPLRERSSSSYVLVGVLPGESLSAEALVEPVMA